MWDKESLIAFEEEIAELFKAQQIHAPVHLSRGNEDQLIKIFKRVQPSDWVFSTWRSHYHALLKGIPVEWIKKEILAGRSMYLINREHHFFASSIMGGILPIALGVAKAIAMDGTKEKVWVFVGDMAARSGVYHEVYDYASGHQLPMHFVIEDNGLSTETPTSLVWGGKTYDARPVLPYTYVREVPHVGIGEWVTFG